MEKKIKILVAHRHWIFREGLCAILGEEEDLECVGIAGDATTAVELTRKLRPDLAVVSIDVSGMDGIEVTKRIREVCPSTAILTVSEYEDDYYTRVCIEAGVEGYVSMDTTREELMNIMRVICTRKHAVFATKTAKMLRSTGTGENSDKKTAKYGVLHAREIQIIELAAKGMSNKEIAAQLHLSVRTVGTHLVNIYKKLGTASRLEATLYALKHGWLNIDEIQKSEMF